MISRATPQVQITAPGLSSLLSRFSDPAGMAVAIARAMDDQNQRTVERIQVKLSGEVLRRQTGKLGKSIQRSGAVVNHAGTRLEIVSSVGSHEGTLEGRAVKYAAIHEFGGVIKPKAPNKWLRFKTADGSWHSVKQVVMPERSYLRSTVRERQPRYSAAFVKAAKDFFLGKAT